MEAIIGHKDALRSSQRSVLLKLKEWVGFESTDMSTRRIDTLARITLALLTPSKQDLAI